MSLDLMKLNSSRKLGNTDSMRRVDCSLSKLKEAFGGLAVLTFLLSSISFCSLADGRTETAGDIGQIAVPLSAAVVTLLKNDQQGLWQLGKGVAVTAASTHLLKQTTQVLRPNGANYESFPSGHTSAAFSGAAFLHHRYGIEYGLPAYLAASYVGYSRVYAGKHWDTDVLAGAALAYTVSYFITSQYQDDRFTVAPAQFGTSDAQGIMFQYQL